MYRIYVLPTTIFLLCAVGVISSNSVARCFQFTWLGPRFNNESVFLNATCQDATRLSAGVPCELPLVVSEDGTWPDVDHIWRNYPNATCILANNDVCAQYTYYFDGHVENSTYLCTRAVDNYGEAITSGCYQDTNGSFRTRVCFCRSVPGGVPCNNSTLKSLSISLFTSMLTVLLLQNNLQDLFKGINLF